MTDPEQTDGSVLVDRVAQLARYGIPTMAWEDERLAVCHSCELIGTVSQAFAHHRSTGHDIEVLDACVADAIRVEWSIAPDNRDGG